MSIFETFEHNGKTYEIRSAQDGGLIRVRAFLDGKPANGYEYTVELISVIDAKMAEFPVDLMGQLATTAANDVRQGYWEQYVAAVQEHDRQRT
ncbi:hypothetical protein [Methylobacillus sp. Pita1]|uniref:hypothetical protein n=1 Tax=Methylobacillus sp. Pita1 TaxID=3382642 RepID=UPI0038B5EAE6